MSQELVEEVDQVSVYACNHKKFRLNGLLKIGYYIQLELLIALKMFPGAVKLH